VNHFGPFIFRFWFFHIFSLRVKLWHFVRKANFLNCLFQTSGFITLSYILATDYTDVEHNTHSGVKFYNFYRKTPILSMKYNLYEFSLFFEDFMFRIQRILKYPWKQMFAYWSCTVLVHNRTCCGKYRIF